MITNPLLVAGVVPFIFKAFSKSNAGCVPRSAPLLQMAARGSLRKLEIWLDLWGAGDGCALVCRSCCRRLPAHSPAEEEKTIYSNGGVCKGSFNATVASYVGIIALTT